MQGDSGRLGLACVTAEAGSIGSHIAQRTGERGPAHGTLTHFLRRADTDNSTVNPFPPLVMYT